jgi:hypothetical protein
MHIYHERYTFGSCTCGSGSGNSATSLNSRAAACQIGRYILIVVVSNIVGADKQRHELISGKSAVLLQEVIQLLTR